MKSTCPEILPIRIGFAGYNHPTHQLLDFRTTMDGQGAQSTSFSQGMPRLQAACSIAMPEDSQLFFSGLPQRLSISPPPSTLNNSYSLPPLPRFHSFLYQFRQNISNRTAIRHPIHKTLISPTNHHACGWKTTFVGFLFQSTMPPCDTAITALRTSLENRGTVGSLSWVYHGCSMLACSLYRRGPGKHTLKEVTRKMVGKKQLWRWIIQICLRNPPRKDWCIFVQDVLAPSHKLHTRYSEHKTVSLNPLGSLPTHWLHHTSQWLQSFQTASIHGPLEHACLGCRQLAVSLNFEFHPNSCLDLPPPFPSHNSEHIKYDW